MNNRPWHKLTWSKTPGALIIMKYQVLFSRKIKKNIVNVLSAELVQGVVNFKVKVCQIPLTKGLKLCRPCFVRRVLEFAIT